MATFEEKLLEEAYSVTPNYDVDYADDRFGKVETDKQQALTELEQTYGGIVNSSSKYYDDLINANQQWADKQAQIQQENTDFAIEKIEQQKEQAQKDYTKEQSGAYVDYKKQSNAYGTNAEKMASAGLTNTGYAESSQVSMYNTYQMRVAAARETLAQAKLNYDNNIKEAMLANNAALAQIYADAYIKQAELALEGFQYKNELMLEMVNKKTELDNIYYSRYQDVLDQINTENALKEDIRQYQETQKWNTEQAKLDREHQSAENLLQREFEAAQNELQRQFNSKENELQRQFDAKQDELARKHDKEMLKAKTAAEKEVLAQQHKNEMAKLEQQHKNNLAVLAQEAANEKAILQYQYNLSKQSSGTTKVLGKNVSSNVANTAKKVVGAIKNATAFKGTTYDSAVKYLKSQGITNTNGLMKENDWIVKKHYNTMSFGRTDAPLAVTKYDSYAAYLQDYVKYLVNPNG